MSGRPGDDAESDDFASWFRLLETPGVGREMARRLLAACGSPAAVLAAPRSALARIAGPAVAEAIGQAPTEHDERLAAALAWLAGRSGLQGIDPTVDRRRVLVLGDADYPPALLQTADPPLLLYVQGDAGQLLAPSIAIVGSRHPTPQGADNARAFARSLAAQRWTVVSGLALGIDGAAHEGAVGEAAGTVAVVGTGPDTVYPTRHAALARRIVESGGAIVSEYAPGTPPLPAHFPPRNRIIAGLTQGTLVVEAALRSGSLITARLASEAGREVFAVPGSIHSPQSKGCHALIKQGAKLVETAADIVDELQSGRPRGDGARGAAADEGEREGEGVMRSDPLLDALGHDPVTIDALMARTGWPASELAAKLLEHELEGEVARLPGGLFQRRHAG